ncbi:hypothetical protein FA95DRAFT_1482965, partial [Auriscalpium vulgare]
VPASGTWLSERVFSIPLTPGDEESSSPGLIVFECSPLGDIDDEIEKKFCILEDCARLRDIVEALPEDRHFIPSILFIVWGEDERSSMPNDLSHMVRCLVVFALLALKDCEGLCLRETGSHPS